MCRANYLPIWEYLVTRVRTEREVDLVRANLALNGIDTGSNRGKVELEEVPLRPPLSLSFARSFCYVTICSPY